MKYVIRILLSVVLFLLVADIQGQTKFKLGALYTSTGSYYNNISVFNEFSYLPNDFLSVGVGAMFFSDMKYDGFFESIKYAYQLSVKSPYVIVGLSPINFDNHNFSISLGYTLGKIEENLPSYYVFDSNVYPPEIKKMIFKQSDIWDSGMIFRLAYDYNFWERYSLGVMLQYTSYVDDNSPEFFSAGFAVGYNFKN